MGTSITDAEWDKLSPEHDELRGYLNDGEDGSPPQLLDDLLNLHQLAMAVINGGSRSQVADLFESAVDLEDEVYGMMTALEQVQETLSQFTALYPESLSYARPDDAD
ncbi:MAG: transposase [Candidatus Thiodiazotropha sp. (ex Rostrolucina anterorostrata)]|nr:transposase [Candidatus Thiodiazotropha sp. (ex Rostrolucina anterorostrata)]